MILNKKNQIKIDFKNKGENKICVIKATLFKEKADYRLLLKKKFPLKILI
jgi:hypothetical protein